MDQGISSSQPNKSNPTEERQRRKPQIGWRARPKSPKKILLQGSHRKITQAPACKSATVGIYFLPKAAKEKCSPDHGFSVAPPSLHVHFGKGVELEGCDLGSENDLGYENSIIRFLEFWRVWKCNFYLQKPPVACRIRRSSFVLVSMDFVHYDVHLRQKLVHPLRQPAPGSGPGSPRPGRCAESFLAGDWAGEFVRRELYIGEGWEIVVLCTLLSL